MSASFLAGSVRVRCPLCGEFVEVPVAVESVGFQGGGLSPVAGYSKAKILPRVLVTLAQSPSVTHECDGTVYG